MNKPASYLALALIVAASAGCSQSSDDSRDGGIGYDTGTDTARVDSAASDTVEPADDVDRAPADIDTDWNPGLTDADADATPLSLDRIVPSQGPVDGGNRVRIAGKGFSGDERVYFGSLKADVRLSSGALVGEVPPATSARVVTVKVVDEDGSTASIPDGYEYVAGVEIQKISPQRIPVEGGTEVTIEGSGFRAPTAVSFDGASALRVRRVDSTKVRAVAPPGSAGSADVRVTTQTETEVREGGVEYVRPLEIESVRPAAGPTAGGAVTQIQVAGLGTSATVELGGTSAKVRNVDPRAGDIEVETPPHSAGLVDVVVRSAGDVALDADAFLYRDAGSPTLATIDPAFGPTSGGTEVELTGQGLDASNLSIEFGGSAASILAAEPTYARVKTPPGSSGAVDVVAKSGGAILGSLSDGFEYRRALKLDRVQPESGPTSGGTTVTLTGSGFQDAEAVYFGGLPASFTVESDSKISAATPVHGPGRVDVRVERDGLEARLREAYEFTTDLAIWGFEPVRGAAAGGTYVEVRGKGFTGTLEADFDGNDAREIRRVDRNNLYLYTPSHDPGETTLTVRANSQSAQGPYPYEYFDPAGRYGGASGGEVDGAVNVTVLSRGGGPIPGAFVMLSTRADSEYTGTTDESGQVTLSGPDVLGPQTVTATAQGFSSATVREIDAENLTLFLRKLNPEGGGGGGGGQPPSATLEGKVETPFKLADPDVNQTYDMAVVKTTKESVYDRRPDPGEGSVVLGEGRYRINSRIGDLAVVAFCGAYDESTDEFDAQYIGVARYLSVSDGEQREADIVCDIPLDRSVEVKIQNPIFAPDGPDNNVARVFWNFGFGGVIEAPTVGRGLGNLIEVDDQPQLVDQLSDVTLTVEAGSFTGESSSPSSQTRTDGVSNLDQPIVMPRLVDVPEPISPKTGETLSGRTIRFQASGPVYPEMYNIYLLNQQGRPFWRYVMDGDKTTVRLPEFPDFSYLPTDQQPDPYRTGRVFALIYGIDVPSVDFDGFTYQDLSFSQWRGYSVKRWSFRMP